MSANDGVLPARWIETDEEVAEERYVRLAFQHLATFQGDLTPGFLTQTFVLRRLYSSRGVARQHFLPFFRVFLSFCLPFVPLAHHLVSLRNTVRRRTRVFHRVEWKVAGS